MVTPIASGLGNWFHLLEDSRIAVAWRMSHGLQSVSVPMSRIRRAEVVHARMSLA
jgi:hypothetical protein